MRCGIWRSLLWMLGMMMLCIPVVHAQDESEQTENEAATSQLTIGSEAPALDVEHWIHDGNGKFNRVTEFEAGKVYVVEFWATWCGPCRASMPHLAQTQEKYGDTIQIVSISDEPLETVEGFLEQKVNEPEEQTFRELTSVYCLTTDPDKSSENDYLRAANKDSIPTAFIIGKDGHIEWIGHPMAMDEPLDKIVHDQWDREAFRKELEQLERINAKLADVSRAMQRNDPKEALRLIDELLTDAPDSAAAQLRYYKLFVLMHSDAPAAVKFLGEFTSETENGGVLNQAAWAVYQRAAAGEEVADDLYAAAIAAAEKAVALTEGAEKGSALDTLAHLKYQQGLEAALKLQQEAAQLADTPDVQQFLEVLQRAKNGDNGPQAIPSEEAVTEEEMATEDDESSDERASADDDDAADDDADDRDDDGDDDQDDEDQDGEDPEDDEDESESDSD